VLSIGPTPLANGLLREAELSLPEPRYPLELVFCPACSLVQITETVPPEKLFSDYPYQSSFSTTMLEHARALAEATADRKGLGPSHRVVEIASNDGYLLQNYHARGIPVLGIEPAQNIAEIAGRKGIPTRREFFGRELAETLAAEGGRADVIHAHNVLAHVPDLNGFAKGLCALLAPDGIALIEVPYLRDLVEGTEFDTIYHEHLSYFSLCALDRLFASNALELADVTRVPIHGGSLRLEVRHRRAASGPGRARVAGLLAEERSLGLDALGYYESFAARVEALKNELLGLLADLKARGQRIAVYGASAKGATLLNFFGIGAETLDFVVDLSSAKQGLYTPGTHLPIRPPEALLEEKPDYTLLLSWNFKEEILEQQDAYRRAGGRFIVPIPKLELV